MSGKFIDIDVNRAMDVLDVMANGGGGRKTKSDEKEEEEKGEEDGVRQNEVGGILEGARESGTRGIENSNQR